MIIADLSGGNLCKNDKGRIKEMIDVLAGIDKYGLMVLKWQLFEKAGNNIPLEKECFEYAYRYAAHKGFRTAASVFDYNSLQYLIEFSKKFTIIEFVKIACRANLYYLGGEVPRKIPLVVSVPAPKHLANYDASFLCCVPEYPATMEQYEENFSAELLRQGISDHTENWELYDKYRPEVYEFHFCLEHDEDNPDAGPFARTPVEIANFLRREELKEI